MKEQKRGVGKVVLFAGLSAALVLGVIANVHPRSNPGGNAITWTERIRLLDAKAKPYFDEAAGNVPAVVRRLSRRKKFLKILWVAAKDKFSGTTHLPYYLAREIEQEIIRPCRKGAAIYGCELDTLEFWKNACAVTGDQAVASLYAASGLAMDAIFLKSTAASIQRVAASAAVRMIGAGSAGAACAAADGPFPFGDALGAALAVGGTLLSGYDLWKAPARFAEDLQASLLASIESYRQACRQTVLES